MAYLGNPKETIAVLQKYGFNFQKKFGQNFLIDTHVLNKIVDAAGVTKDDLVLEICASVGKDTADLSMKVLADEKLLVSITATVKQAEGKVEMPEDYIGVDSEQDLQAWLESVNAEALLQKLENAGIPKQWLEKILEDAGQDQPGIDAGAGWF